MNSLGQINIRKATLSDVDRIVRICHAGSFLNGKTNTDLPQKLPDSYYSTFERIEVAADSYLMVAEIDGNVVGTFQLEFLTYLVAQGREDAQVESVHVAEDFRGNGIGGMMITWVIEQARARNCRRVQLTTNKLRKDAHRFYKRLGFEDSHEGMKLNL